MKKKKTRSAGPRPHRRSGDDGAADDAEDRQHAGLRALRPRQPVPALARRFRAGDGRACHRGAAAVGLAPLLRWRLRAAVARAAVARAAVARAASGPVRRGGSSGSGPVGGEEP